MSRDHVIFLLCVLVSLLFHAGLVVFGDQLTRGITRPLVSQDIAAASRLPQIVEPITEPVRALEPLEVKPLWGERGSRGTAAASLDVSGEHRAALGLVDSPQLTRGRASPSRAEVVDRGPLQARAAPSLPEPVPTITDAVWRSQFRKQAQQPKPEPSSPGSTPLKASSPDLSSSAADRDVDAFSSKEGLDLRNGRLSARPGREFKFARPQIDTAFRVDAAQLGLPVGTLLRIRIDQTGSPRSVTVIRSSRSQTIDQSIKVAAYASWFEPIEPLEFDFGVTFR